jgi:hypothetical protein
VDIHTEQTIALGLPALAPSAGRVARGVARVVDAMPAPFARLWHGPAVFPAAFALGFIITLGVGALALWRTPGPDELLAAGRADEVLALLPQSGLSAEQQLWKGHALHEKGDTDAMLRAYQEALAAGALDGRARQNTIEALGHAKSTSLAVKTLEEGKGGELDDVLSSVAGDGDHARRHGALEALRARASADAERRLKAAVLVAVTDVRSDVCVEKAEGVQALAGFVDVPAARPHLKEFAAWDAVLALNNESIFALNPCLDKALVKKTDTALGAAERR